MRAAPPIQVSLRHFGVWRAAVATTALAGAGGCSAWASVGPLALAPAPLAGAGVVLLATLWGWVQPLWRVRPAELRWDGRAWHLGPTFDAMTPGEVEVAVDLGGWLLLRFVEAWPLGPRWRRRVHWLPVQRRGLEARWHALRCAVHTPRPALAEVSAPAAVE